MIYQNIYFWIVSCIVIVFWIVFLFWKRSATKKFPWETTRVDQPLLNTLDESLLLDIQVKDELENLHCPICLQDFHFRESIFEFHSSETHLVKKHLVHKKCIEQWFLNGGDRCIICGMIADGT